MYRVIQQPVHVTLIIFVMEWYVSQSMTPSVSSSFQLYDLIKDAMQAEQNIKGCYKLKSLQPVDMFPHTPHIECVCLLELCDNPS